MLPFFKKSLVSKEFALLRIRNIKIRYRLILSYFFSTLLPLTVVYLYFFFLYGNSAPAGRLLLIFIMLMCVPMVMTACTYLSISHPIRHMVRTCQAISDGNLDVRIQDSSNDELAFLSDNIDGMVTEIQLLLEQRQESEAKKGNWSLKCFNIRSIPIFFPTP